MAVSFLLESLLQPPTRPFASFLQYFQFDVPQRPNRWLIRIHIPFYGLRFMLSDEEPFHASIMVVLSRCAHRVAAAPIDLDRDGRLDLVLAGASYQMGIERDPNPGGGMYYALNRGFQPDGTPLLDPVHPLKTIGHAHRFSLNTHAQLQSLDLLGNGERLLVIATQDDGFRGYVYRPAQGRLAVEFTGMTLPGLSIEERLLDLDGDGRWEYVRSGGETLITTYARVIIPGGRQ